MRPLRLARAPATQRTETCVRTRAGDCADAVRNANFVQHAAHERRTNLGGAMLFATTHIRMTAAQAYERPSCAVVRVRCERQQQQQRWFLKAVSNLRSPARSYTRPTRPFARCKSLVKHSIAQSNSYALTQSASRTRTEPEPEPDFEPEPELRPALALGQV